MPVYLRGSQEGLFSFVLFSFFGGGGLPPLEPWRLFQNYKYICTFFRYSLLVSVDRVQPQVVLEMEQTKTWN